MEATRSLRWIAPLGLLGVIAAFVLSAAQSPHAQEAPTTAVPVAPTSTSPAAAPRASPPTAPVSPAEARGTSPALRPPASAPEETATIHDDPTVAPDSQDSADNAVTFPSDI
jgi:hypothetical protein